MGQRPRDSRIVAKLLAYHVEAPRERRPRVGMMIRTGPAATA